VLGSQILFFLYSDLQREGLFSGEWNRLLGSLLTYTTLHNRAISEKNIGLHPLPENQLPFWYHCGCNGKVALKLGEKGDAVGACETCGTQVRLPVRETGGDLSRWLPRMSLSAVSRNIVFSEGLGTRLWVSGTGGGLRYGQIANEISRSLGFHLPVTLAWISKDHFLGLAQRIGLREITRTFQLQPADLARSDVKEKIRRYQEDLRKTIGLLEADGKNPKDLQRYRGRYTASMNKLAIVKHIFAFTPSMLDLLMQFPGQFIAHEWEMALTNATLEEHEGMIMVKNDVIYREEYPGHTPMEIPLVYRNIAAIEME
jgi:hypothetical protein